MAFEARRLFSTRLHAKLWAVLGQDPTAKMANHSTNAPFRLLATKSRHHNDLKLVPLARGPLGKLAACLAFFLTACSTPPYRHHPARNGTSRFRCIEPFPAGPQKYRIVSISCVHHEHQQGCPVPAGPRASAALCRLPPRGPAS